MNHTCASCFTIESVQWRKSQYTGKRLCNKCGVYESRHGIKKQPLLVIRKRLHPRKQKNPRRANYE